MLRSRRQLRFESLEDRRLLASVHMPVDLTGAPGSEVVAPVIIDNAAGVRAAEIRLLYDPNILRADAAVVQPGSVWSTVQDVELVANVDDLAGSIVVFVFSAEELGSGGGSLIEIAFTVSDGIEIGVSTDIDLLEVRLNEGAIPVDPAPRQGPDPTDGQITVLPPDMDGEVARVSGTVYADTNGNQQVDPLEGIAGFTVTLVHVSTGDQRATLTDHEGRYEFVDLLPGSYRIVQQQPSAFFTDGPTELAVELAGGQHLTNQDFRQLGLRPEFVYTRLFTTFALPVGSSPWTAVVEQINADAASSVNVGQSAFTAQAVAPAGETVPALVPTEEGQGEGASTEIAGALAAPMETQESLAELPLPAGPPGLMADAAVAEGEWWEPVHAATGAAAESDAGAQLPAAFPALAPVPGAVPGGSEDAFLVPAGAAVSAHESLPETAAGCDALGELADTGGWTAYGGASGAIAPAIDLALTELMDCDPLDLGWAAVTAHA